MILIPVIIHICNDCNQRKVVIVCNLREKRFHVISEEDADFVLLNEIFEKRWKVVTVRHDEGTDIYHCDTRISLVCFPLICPSFLFVPHLQHSSSSCLVFFHPLPLFHATVLVSIETSCSFSISSYLFSSRLSSPPPLLITLSTRPGKWTTLQSWYCRFLSPSSLQNLLHVLKLRSWGVYYLFIFVFFVHSVKTVATRHHGNWVISCLYKLSEMVKTSTAVTQKREKLQRRNMLQTYWSNWRNDKQIFWLSFSVPVG